MLLIASPFSFSPVAFVRAANTAAQTGTATTDTLAFDASGCDFIVGFTANLGSGSGMTSASATYAGASMTTVSGTPFGPGTGGSSKIAAFYLANPTTGSNNYVCTWSPSQARWSSGVIGFSGGRRVISGLQTSNAGGTLNVTSSVNSIVVAAQCNQAAISETLNSGTTSWGVTGSSFSHAGGYRAGAASVSISWVTDDVSIVHVAFSVD